MHITAQYRPGNATSYSQKLNEFLRIQHIFFSPSIIRVHSAHNARIHTAN